ncbi:MAG: hypothetical protein ABIB43_03760 [archaeon]
MEENNNINHNNWSNNMRFKRKLYTRGSSFETTIPMPILFATNKKAKHDVIFEYDETNGRWYIKVEKAENEDEDEELAKAEEDVRNRVDAELNKDNKSNK